ncbi:MAG: tetratricopeptide repeat protein [Spirochaetes bacterium]|nr:tetratricopeptide repeat protein [Spirochaetota bacterium]
MEKLKAEELVTSAYNKLKARDATGAAQLLDKALELDFENEEVKHALKCVHWWLEYTKRLDDIQEPYEKGGFILSLFKQYHIFLRQFDKAYDLCQYAVRAFAFSAALSFFESLLVEGANQNDPELLLLVGRCYKGLGNYDEALKFLAQVVRFQREDAEALAELADVNALLSENLAAKALFREAFFVDPGKVNMHFLESDLFLRLREKVAEMGCGEDDICEWIPVYGYLWGVFSVKRELKQVEVSRLKQSIFAMETERMANPKRWPEIKPRLLNRYFWLIDHYENSRSDPALIEECLLKIKVTDPDIYSRYTK